MGVVGMIEVGMMDEVVGTKAGVVAGTDICISMFFIPFPIFIKTLRTMFDSSVGEELYCFPFYCFLVRFIVFLVYFMFIRILLISSFVVVSKVNACIIESLCVVY